MINSWLRFMRLNVLIPVRHIIKHLYIYQLFLIVLNIIHSSHTVSLYHNNSTNIYYFFVTGILICRCWFPSKRMTSKWQFVTSFFLDASWRAFSWYNLSSALICPRFTSSTACQKMNVVAWSSAAKPSSQDRQNSHFRTTKHVDVAVL